MKYHRGVVFIFEGDTEKIFYIALIEYLCKKYKEYNFTNITPSGNGSGDEIYYELSSPNEVILIKTYPVNAISNMTKSGIWFANKCHKAYPKLNWTVFLCYDTDDYKENITKFYEGDWSELRECLSGYKANTIIDLAAAADIEDIMLLDSDGICKYMGQPPCPIPDRKKGKHKMKALFRSFGPGIAYHEGERAKGLIESLDMGLIIEKSSVNLSEIERICFNDIFE